MLLPNKLDKELELTGQHTDTLSLPEGLEQKISPSQRHGCKLYSGFSDGGKSMMITLIKH